MRAIVIILSMLAITACVAPKFEPATLEGARCKQSCSADAQRCRNHPLFCDSNYSKCIESCIDIERVITMSK